MRLVVASSLAAALLLAPAARAGDPPRKTPEIQQLGKASFAKNCASCHGPGGEGDGIAAKALNPKPRNLVTEPLKGGSKVEQVFATLSTGVKGTAMIAFKHLSEEERWALAYHVLALHGGGKARAR